METASRFQQPSNNFRSFYDVGIDIPLDSVGEEIRTTCPQCSHDRKKSRDRCLTVNRNKQVWFCHHCGWSGGLIDENKINPRLPVSNTHHDKRKRDSLRQVWNSSFPSSHPDAEPLRRYLCNRGLGKVVGHLTKVVRFHPKMAYWQDGQWLGMFPAILCRVDSPDGKPVSIHRTFLTSDGYKAPVSNPKKLMSPAIAGSTRGAAIRLHRPARYLAVAEGVETALAVYIATQTPTWATISAGGMEALILPEAIQHILIMSDLDRSKAGEMAAYKLAKRLFNEGRDARIVIPEGPTPEGCKSIDWLDVLNGEVSA